ncbi:hypothetical protein BS50DRAFT_588466 [Corynespora cassiicola Philippines]|uniref:Uncharacterized protein n=1 Tax=Corynespora cassiicola Philippines TaxID=1448308 RepID=A0A2T2NQ47_CORCC|nr:hypothetical protein BS50DRAFT_588466 [Corynespora cassiicola Philippines]
MPSPLPAKEKPGHRHTTPSPQAMSKSQEAIQMDIEHNEKPPSPSVLATHLPPQNTLSIPRTGLELHYSSRPAPNPAANQAAHSDPTAPYTFAPAVSTQPLEDDWTEIRDVSADWAMVDRDCGPESASGDEKTDGGKAEAVREERGEKQSVRTAIPSSTVAQEDGDAGWSYRGGVAWRPFGMPVLRIEGGVERHPRPSQAAGCSTQMPRPSTQPEKAVQAATTPPAAPRPAFCGDW